MNDFSSVVWLNSPGHIEIKKEQLAPIKPNEVLCSTIVSVISPGTELAAYRGLAPLRPSVSFPRLLGYCNVARITEVGKDVNSYKVGERVLTSQSHRSAFAIDEKNILLKLSEEADPGEVVFAYLFHLGYNAVLRSNIKQGSRVVVIGLGVLGLTTIANAVVAGGQVFGLGDYELSQEIAKQYGAEGVFKRTEKERLLSCLGPGLADVVVVTTNSWADWEIALQIAGQLGTIAVLGFPGRGQAGPEKNPLDSQYFYMKQLRIEAVGFSPDLPDTRGFNRFNERANLGYIVKLIDTGRLKPSMLCQESINCLMIEDAYRKLLENRSASLTYVLKWNQ